jgi:hypothetical protein
MSYDLYLFRAGTDPRAADEDDGERGRRDPAAEALKRKVADALIALDPALDEHVFDHDEIARLHKMPIEEAYERFRYIELSDVSAGGAGTQITLFDDHASVTIPYWHEGAAARAPFERLWAYLDVICREADYEVYDPQLDRVIERGAFEDVLACYSDAMRRIRGVIADPPRRRPWWKFW